MNPQKTASELSSYGRHGDSMLMHVQPQEVAGLQALAMANGTSLTQNPDTGLPEAFSLGGLLGGLLPTLAGGALTIGTGGAISPLVAGLLTGATTAAVTGDLGQGIMGGLGGYGGATLGTSLANAGASTGANATAGNELMSSIQSGAAPGNIENIANAQNLINSGQQVGMANSFNPTMAPGLDVGATPSLYNTPATQVPTAPGGGMTQALTQPSPLNASNTLAGAKNLFSPGGYDAFKAAGGNAMQLASPAIAGVLGGLEETDIYGKPIKVTNKDKYDPYARLNLGNDTGLRLFAGGGSVAGGGRAALQGGGNEATRGSGSFTPVGAPQTQQQQQPRGMANAFGGFGMAPQNTYTPPKLGLFATKAQIDAANKEAEAQMAKADSMAGLSRYPQYGFMGMGNTGGSIGGMAGYANRIGQPAETTEPENQIGSLNLKQQPSIRFAAGGLAELSNGSTGQPQMADQQQMQPLQQQTYGQQPMVSTVQQGGNMDLYGSTDNPQAPNLSSGGYGLGRLTQMANANQQGFAGGGYLKGDGDGMSDDIPAMIDGQEPARLASEEFVIPADVVSHIGNGSSEAGAKRLYAMLDRVREARTGNPEQGKQINPNKYLPA